jgi:hypothetical protein
VFINHNRSSLGKESRCDRKKPAAGRMRFMNALAVFAQPVNGQPRALMLGPYNGVAREKHLLYRAPFIGHAFDWPVRLPDFPHDEWFPRMGKSQGRIQKKMYEYARPFTIWCCQICTSDDHLE